jgi:hypothetical protein
LLLLRELFLLVCIVCLFDDRGFVYSIIQRNRYFSFRADSRSLLHPHLFLFLPHPFRFPSLLPAFRIFRGMFMIAIFIGGLACNCYIWQKYRVNYVFIFSLNSRLGILCFMCLVLALIPILFSLFVSYVVPLHLQLFVNPTPAQGHSFSLLACCSSVSFRSYLHVCFRPFVSFQDCCDK